MKPHKKDLAAGVPKSAVNAFMAAAQAGNNDAIAKWLRKYGARRIDIRDETNRTALIWAACDRKTETVRLLLDLGASPDSAANNGMTALLAASIRDDPGSIAALADHGADLEKGAGEKTPLQTAVEFDNKAAALALVSRGARTDVRNSEGEGILDTAKFWKDSGIRAALQAEIGRRAGAEAERICHEGLREKVKGVRPLAFRRHHEGSP